MINKTQRYELKRILKSNFMRRVFEVLEEKQIFSKKGEPYKKAYISNVLNGRENNIKIENVLFFVYNEKKTELLNNRVLRKQIINKKPEAVTSGI
ncbi:hypothetical protein [Flavobacterium columnare]|uniref:hypothetical protein n=1 Tax=Flavobacterium columnare TaxID=996 RepID=UPI00403398B0